MKPSGTIALILAACFALAGLSGAALAQQPKAQAPAKAPLHEPQKMTLKGKFHQRGGPVSYYLRTSGESYGILNPNPEVLDALVKSGKAVTVVGKPSGDLLNIEQIDGKPYTSKQQPVSK